MQGRNDLLLFDFQGRKVLFEIFATKGQVSRDLRILDKTRADKKIAVIIDKEVDPGVWEQIHKEKPEGNYAWFSYLSCSLCLSSARRLPSFMS
jgi:hypothetical protein